MSPGFALQFLKSGKALCSAAFPTLVDTWNWTVAALSNLTGDADGNAAVGGRITVDWTAPEHPVIRCKGCDSALSSAWELDLDSSTLKNCLWTMGGVSFFKDSLSFTAAETGYLCAKIEFTGESYSDDDASAAFYSSIEDVREAQKSADVFVAPLYKRNGGNNWIDLRTGVHVQVFDIFGQDEEAAS